MAKLSELLPGIIAGFSEEFSEGQKAKRTQREKLEQILATAQTESAFDPQKQAKAELLRRIGAMRPPQPEGGFSRSEMENPRLAEAFQPVINATEQRQFDALLQLAGVKQEKSLAEKLLEKELLAAAQARGTASETPLSPQQKAVEQSFSDLLSAADRIDAMLASDKGFKGQLFRTGIPFQPGAGTLADDLLNMSDVLLRLRSGAQINEKEFERLRGLLPRSRDAISELLGNPDRAREKIARFKRTAQEILTTKRTRGGTSFSQATGEKDDFVHQLESQGYTVEALP